MISQMDKNTLFVTAASLNGVIFGTMVWAGMVDNQAFTKLAESGNLDVPKIFHLWWPRGTSLMVPLVSIGTILNAGSFVFSDDITWLIPVSCYFVIGAWTGLAMNRVITDLRNDEKDLLKNGKNVVLSNLASYSNHHLLRSGIGFLGLFAGNAALMSCLKI